MLVELKRAWADDTSHLLFEPLEFLEKLAALTPRPRVNLILYHGVLAPHGRWRGRVGPAPAAELPVRGASLGDGGGAFREATRGPRRPGRHWRWADLMRRAFDIGVLACPRCGNRMRLLATIEDPQMVERILTHLGLPSATVRPRPPHAPSEFVGTLAADSFV